MPAVRHKSVWQQNLLARRSGQSVPDVDGAGFLFGQTDAFLTQVVRCAQDRNERLHSAGTLDEACFLHRWTHQSTGYGAPLVDAAGMVWLECGTGSVLERADQSIDLSIIPFVEIRGGPQSGERGLAFLDLDQGPPCHLFCSWPGEYFEALTQSLDVQSRDRERAHATGCAASPARQAVQGGGAGPYEPRIGTGRNGE